MNSTLNEFDEVEPARPTLLTVLCILTFIGSSWSILTGIWQYTTAEKTSSVLEKTTGINKSDSLQNSNTVTIKNDTVTINESHHDGKFFGKKMKASLAKIMTPDNIRKTAIGALISSILTLLGALLMWGLNRKGFYIYILGTLIGILVPFFLYGNNLLAIGISSFSGFFGLVFIALYALNLKNMKRPRL